MAVEVDERGAREGGEFYAHPQRAEIGRGGDQGHGRHEEAQAGEKARFRGVGEELTLLDVALDVLFVFFAQVAHGVHGGRGEEHGGQHEKDGAEKIGLEQAEKSRGMRPGEQLAQGERRERKVGERGDHEQGAAGPRTGNEHEKSGQKRDEKEQGERHVSPSGCGSAPRRWSRTRCLCG